MRYEIKEKIYNDPNMFRFLRENSNWYKLLNRGVPLARMENEMKERYGLRFRDKVDKVGTGVSLLKAFMDVTKES